MFKIYKNLYYYLKLMDKQKVICLTPKEEQIFNMLKTYKNELQLNTVLRVAGGWVRDKLLGKDSHDIDIALDNMKGEEFVTLLKKHAELKHDKISGFGVTKFNPQMSKHLETATANIHGYWIDFVNLRSEKYGEDSRIPIIDIGTPKEDAQRRDFTINSMFYNIDTEMVEDWTGKGFEDLENKILRTPLQPYVTLLDDPLRILRCIRFKSRFNFKVEENIYAALAKPQIKQALLHKVSKQRIGTQLSGILKAQNPMVGLIDIKQYQLWNIVFEVPQKTKMFENKEFIAKIPEYSFACTEAFLYSLETNGWRTQNELITCEQEAEEKPKKKGKIQYIPSELKFNMMISALTYVYRNEQVEVGKSKSNLTLFMVKDQLKYAAKNAKFATHFAEVVDKAGQITSLDNMFAIIRWLRFAEEKWEIALHFLWAVQEIDKSKQGLNVLALRELVLKNELYNCYLAEPPINGNFLTQKGIKGPVIRDTLENAVIWRIINPGRPAEDFLAEFDNQPDFFMSKQTYR